MAIEVLLGIILFLSTGMLSLHENHGDFGGVICTGQVAVIMVTFQALFVPRLGPYNFTLDFVNISFLQIHWFFFFVVAPLDGAMASQFFLECCLQVLH